MVWIYNSVCRVRELWVRVRSTTKRWWNVITPCLASCSLSIQCAARSLGQAVSVPLSGINTQERLWRTDPHLWAAKRSDVSGVGSSVGLERKQRRPGGYASKPPALLSGGKTLPSFLADWALSMQNAVSLGEALVCLLVTWCRRALPLKMKKRSEHPRTRHIMIHRFYYPLYTAYTARYTVCTAKEKKKWRSVVTWLPWLRDYHFLSFCFGWEGIVTWKSKEWPWDIDSFLFKILFENFIRIFKSLPHLIPEQPPQLCVFYPL